MGRFNCRGEETERKAHAGCHQRILNVWALLIPKRNSLVLKMTDENLKRAEDKGAS